MGLRVRQIDIDSEENAKHLGTVTPSLLDGEWIVRRMAEKLQVFNILCIGICSSGFVFIFSTSSI